MKEARLYLNSLLNNNDIIVVACSGGPDSMCLLHLLCELKEKFNLKIIVAHVNHKLRVESNDEALFVKNVCEKNNIEYEYMEILEYNNSNIENDAREKRYKFFNELVLKYHANYLMTAHHGDDLMETILMRLTRGSSLKGYSGFHKVVVCGSYKIVRPLINETKEEITEYMHDNNYDYVIDKSNFSDKITRNRYRKNVLPFLKNEHKNVHKKFLKFSEELMEANLFIESYVVEILNKISNEKGIKVSELLKLDNFLLKKVIEYLLSSVYIDDLFLIHDKHTECIIGLIKTQKSNSKVMLPSGVVATKTYDYFRIEKLTEIDSYEYVIEDTVTLPNSKIIKKIDISEKKSNFVIRLNSKDLSLPLIVRNRRTGDKMEIKNLGGTKKIKDIFIDEKISPRFRDTIPVVTDQRGCILWVPGVKKSKFDVEKDGIYDIILSYEEEN